jgi:acyl carrier protein
MSNRAKLQQLFLDVFLLDASEFHFELRRADIDTWDSLGVVSLAVGIHQTFGYHPTPDEATSLASVADVIALLESHGIPLAS